MQLNSTPLRAALIAGIITLILIGVYVICHQDVNEAQTTLSKQPPQAQLVGKDPFKEYLDKQQQGVRPLSSPPHHQVIVGNSTTTIPVGSDPFKAFLELQSKAKPEEAAISPFSGGK